MGADSPARAADLDGLAAALRTFADDRDWAQFHTPKNLAMALVGEAGELAAVFQWLTPEQSADLGDPELVVRVRDELADVFLYLVHLADVVGVNLLEVAEAKIKRNEQRYPIELSRGRAGKYSDLGR